VTNSHPTNSPGARLRSPGARLRRAIEEERPLQMVGAVNAFCALLAQSAGFRAIYLSGAGVANASFGLPDLGITNLNEVTEDVRRITAVTELPLMVDAVTGWGNALGIARTVRELSRAGAAGCHIEDQVQAKRCGHRPNKELVEPWDMADRIKAATDAKIDRDFMVMARTDAVAVEGLGRALERSKKYVEAGADLIFAEAVTNLEDYRRFTETLGVPVLANLTEFGKTPLYSIDQMRVSGIRIILYPLSAFRAMAAAAETVYQTIRRTGSQQDVLSTTQTRERLYEVLNYHEFESRLDSFSKHQI
jgi:methylisocitrate lyase